MSFTQLEKEIARSRNFAVGAVAMVVTSYIINMWVIHSGNVSSDMEVWGQFGDFIGGTLNPLIAYLAFYWLTRSVLLQKQELSETKDALRESAQAQLKQEKHAARTAKLNALNSILASYNSDLTLLRDDAQFVAGQLARAMNNNIAHSVTGLRINYHDAKKYVATTYEKLGEVFDKRRETIERINFLLSQDEV